MYIHRYICISIYVYTYTYVKIFSDAHTISHISVFLSFTHAQAHTRTLFLSLSLSLTHTHTYKHTHTHTHAHTHTNKYLHICIVRALPILQPRKRRCHVSSRLIGSIVPFFQKQSNRPSVRVSSTLYALSCTHDLASKNRLQTIWLSGYFSWTDMGRTATERPPERLGSKKVN